MQDRRILHRDLKTQNIFSLTGRLNLAILALAKS
jgi:hypothetical protein